MNIPPPFRVVQMAVSYPDETVLARLDALNEVMLQDLYRGVGVIHSYEGKALYAIYEKINSTENQAEIADDNLQGVEESKKGG